MKNIISIIVISFGLLISCQGDVSEEYVTSLCIEGWIEPGEYPIVMVSETFFPNTSYQPVKEAYTHSLHQANVTITVNGQSYILTERITTAYQPSYIYTTDALVGQEGMTYHLEVSYNGITAFSHATIPSVIEADSIVLRHEIANQITLSAFLTDPSETDDWYKAFILYGESSNEMFLSSFLSTVSDRDFQNNQIVMPLYQGRVENGEYYTPFFDYNERITIKICHIDSVAYHYWREYDKMLVLSRNPFLKYQDNLPGNIKGGLGYWFGYGSTVYQITPQNNSTSLH